MASGEPGDNLMQMSLLDEGAKFERMNFIYSSHNADKEKGPKSFNENRAPESLAESKLILDGE
jgi:hypothetical protein